VTNLASFINADKTICENCQT